MTALRSGGRDTSAATSFGTHGASLRRAATDLVFGVLATLCTLPSLLYPLGRDQGLYFYVAREWVQRGAIPYRDVLDHKTPGIYVLHALAITLFGAKASSIRIVEALGVLGFGLALGSAMADRDRAHTPGVRGFGMFALALIYFGFFDFWNSGQSEIWYSGIGVLAAWAAHRVQRPRLAAFVTGLACGIIPVVKPPGIGFAAVALGLLAVRLWRALPQGTERRRLLRDASLLCGLGGALAPLAVLAYFGAHDAVPAMRDIVVGANAYYVKHESGFVTSKSAAYAEIIAHFGSFVPLLMGAALLGLVKGFVSRPKTGRTELLALAWIAAAAAGVTVQQKFYLLHWGCLPVGLACAACAAFARLTALPKGAIWAPPLVAAMLLGLYVTTPGNAAIQRDTLQVEYQYVRGQASLSALHERFEMPWLGFSYRDSHALGTWLAEHTSADEAVTVRGFQPEVYAIANRRHRGRFFWTTFLTNPARAYRRAEWLAEDARDLREHPPRYLVALTDIHEGLDSCEFYEAMGYRRVQTFRGLTVMERR